MLIQLDNLFPWFGDMLELGGDILLLIIILATLLWTLILERIVYHWLIFPSKRQRVLALWNNREDHSSWFAFQYRQRLLTRMQRELVRNQGLLGTLIKVCPLLGLLGTVMGMLEIFDALAVTGSNSARTTAGGVSKATVSTMAGMVVAISGLMISNLINRQAQHSHNKLQESMPMAVKNSLKNNQNQQQNPVVNTVTNTVN